MKKGILFCILFMTTGVANAQNLYVALGGGFGLSVPSEVVGTSTMSSASGELTTANNYGSYGGGTNVGLNVGYMLSQNFGAELGFSYLSGSPLKSTEYTNASGGTSSTIGRATQMRLSPALILSSNGNIAGYGKIGLVLPFGGSLVENYVDRTDPSILLEQDFETKGAMSIGFLGAIGIKYGVSNKLSLFGEISGVNMRIKSASRSTTLYMENGVDFLASTATYAKEVIYVDELNSTSNNSTYNSDFDNTKAKESLATSSNFNGLFFSLGVKYTF